MQTLELARRHLDSHDIPWQKDRQLLPEISGDSVPKLLSADGDLKDHFMKMAADLGEEYFKLALELSSSIKTSPPPPPSVEDIEILIAKQSSQNFQGWFKYNNSSENSKWEEAKEGPIDKVILFDVETCPLISQFPLLACAYGPSGWYIWLQSLEKYNNQSSFSSSDLTRLIPLQHPILVIGHHVAFDRARVRQEYSLERSDRRFLDTLSMHCAVAGLSSQQRGLWQERKKKRAESESEEHNELDDEIDAQEHNEHSDSMSTEKWGSRSSLNNLSDALQLHCNRKLDKSVRDNVLLKSSDVSEIYAQLPEIAAYCAKDVEATFQLFSVLFPKFLKKSPHAVTFSALLEMGSFVLPIVKKDWNRYIETCDGLYDEATQKIELELVKAVEETVCEGLQSKKRVFSVVFTSFCRFR
jgi:DNA polymerase gamma 1